MATPKIPVYCASCAADPEIVAEKWRTAHRRAGEQGSCMSCGSKRYRPARTPRLVDNEAYLRMYPDTPGHMVCRAGFRGVVAPGSLGDFPSAGMIEADDRFGWPGFPGTDGPDHFLQYRVIDIREYPTGWLRDGWVKDFPDTPFRLYFEDGDDWNAERMFSTLAEAAETLRLLLTADGPITSADLVALNILPT